MSRYYKGTIEVLIEVPEGEPLPEAYAADAVAEILRPVTKRYNEQSDLVDWRYQHDGEGYAYPEPHSGEGFEEVDVERNEEERTITVVVTEKIQHTFTAPWPDGTDLVQALADAEDAFLQAGNVNELEGYRIAIVERTTRRGWE